MKEDGWLHKLQFYQELEDRKHEAQKYFKVWGFLYKPRKARFIPTFCKRINCTSTALGN